MDGWGVHMCRAYPHQTYVLLYNTVQCVLYISLTRPTASLADLFCGQKKGGESVGMDKVGKRTLGFRNRSEWEKKRMGLSINLTCRFMA